MIFVALGANLPSAAHGPPAAGLRAALAAMPAHGIVVSRVSRFYRSAPVPASDQPWYVNAVAEVESGLPPQALLRALLDIEAAFGRVRLGRNDARVLDLDLLDYHGKVGHWPASGGLPALDLPHPRLVERAFVLLPLADLAPAWRHPASGEGLEALIAALPPSQAIEPCPGPAGEA
ncbi:MAG: 2-amino-4-hydroxy-6-hydroxymethyldihydropteridine diphosphokinase [Alphaproteobacteria bacterium]